MPIKLVLSEQLKEISRHLAMQQMSIACTNVDYHISDSLQRSSDAVPGKDNKIDNKQAESLDVT